MCTCGHEDIHHVFYIRACWACRCTGFEEVHNASHDDS